MLSTSVIFVKETELVVINQFGRPVRNISEAGLAFKLPDPIQTRISIDRRLNLLALAPSEFVTRDKRNLVLNAFMIWRISDPVKFLASVRNQTTAEQRLETLAYSQIGAGIGALPMGDIFTLEDDRSALAVLFEDIGVQTNDLTLSELGIEVKSIRPEKFGFPRQNLLAIYKRMESERNRIARQYQAEGNEEASKIRAETELEVRKLQAEAYRDGQMTVSTAEAEAAKIFAEAFETNEDFFQFTRSLDAYEKIFSEDSQLILSSDLPIFDQLLDPSASQ